jgi:hypothetical protein
LVFSLETHTIVAEARKHCFLSGSRGLAKPQRARQSDRSPGTTVAAGPVSAGRKEMLDFRSIALRCLSDCLNASRRPQELAVEPNGQDGQRPAPQAEANGRDDAFLNRELT